jgi:antitoxin component YwqK of YwqJK toxin-antitoxin module
MKKTLFLLLFVSITIPLLAQNSEDKTVYLDSLWKETTMGDHKYYRIIKEYNTDKDNYQVTDYFKSGKVQMEGTFSDKDAKLKMGAFTYYYENGNKQSAVNYGKPGYIGKYAYWYENGNKQLEGEYLETKTGISSELKIDQYWNPEAKQIVIDGNGYFEESDNFFYAKGNIKNGLRDGTWVGNNKKAPFSYTEKYENGKLISGLSIDSDNVEHHYTELETKPIPKRGIEHFYQYIGKNFNVTRESEKNNIYGKLISTFIVEKDGTIVDIKIIKSLGFGLDEELIRVLSECPAWTPGEQRGIKVRVLYSIPITIQKR